MYNFKSHIITSLLAEMLVSSRNSIQNEKQNVNTELIWLHFKRGRFWHIYFYVASENLFDKVLIYYKERNSGEFLAG